MIWLHEKRVYMPTLNFLHLKRYLPPRMYFWGRSRRPWRAHSIWMESELGRMQPDSHVS